MKSKPMTKKAAAKKAVKKVSQETVPCTFHMKKKNKIPFIKVADQNFQNISSRLNYLIEQDIKNNLITKENGI